MPELLLQYIWLRGLFLTLPQQTTDGRRVEVLDVGRMNHDAGPDFFSATIRIGGMTWTGNVEIHLRSSDWYRHGHQSDPAYDSVILHVVKVADREVCNSKGEQLAQCELQYPADPDWLREMLSDKASLCAQKILADPSIVKDDWQTALLQDRMLKKTSAIRQLLMLSTNDWEQAFYITLAHNFGFHTNGLPFELLAKQTPLACIRKHRDSLFQLEAILFGQSGLLNAETAVDPYSQRLWKEYCFLQKKFSLVPIDGSLWKLLRMRPQNFPHVRIAQFAALLHKEEALLSKVLPLSNPKDLRPLLSVQASEYWQTHYRFGAEVPPKEEDAAQRGALGKSAIDVLLINSVAPYQYAWSKAHMNMAGQEAAFSLLRLIPAEKNSIIARWKMLGIRIRTAAESQAFLHLYQDWCIRQRCLSCDVGYQIFTPDIEKRVEEEKQTASTPRKREWVELEIPF